MFESLSRSRVDQSREEEEVFEQSYFAVKLAKKKKGFKIDSSKVEDNDSKERVKQLILDDDLWEPGIHP